VIFTRFRIASIVLTAVFIVGAEGGRIIVAEDLADSVVREIETAFSNYNLALVDKKYDELTQYIQAPFVVVDNTTRIVSDVAVVIGALRSTREALDQRAYATSIPDKAEISVLSPDRILMNRVVRHYATDGALLETRANYYLMSKASGTWKINGLMPQDAAYTGKIYPDAQRRTSTSVGTFEGIWKLDPAQTKFVQGAPPRTQTVFIQRQGSDFLYTVTGTSSSASTTLVRYVVPIAGGDGKFLDGPYDGVRHKRIDSRTREAVYLLAGKEVLSFHGEVAKNGKLLTITVKGTGPGGESVSGISIYKKADQAKAKPGAR
jgi:hypothetical protein